MMKTWTAFLLLILPALPLGAQQAIDVPIPQVAPFSHWKVQYSYPEQEKKAAANPDAPAEQPPPRLTSVEYLITGKVGQVLDRYSNGSSETKYWVGKHQLSQPRGRREIQLLENSGASSTKGLLQIYPGLEWLSAKNYGGVRDFNGEACHYFHKEETLAEQLDVDPSTLPENSNVTSEAWISVASGRPVVLLASGIKQQFTFLPAPTQPLELPNAFREFLAQKFAPGPRPGQSASFAR